nr:2-amino-4-oxopentanoate thiolase subunit OrtB [Tissierella sp.]
MDNLYQEVMKRRNSIIQNSIDIDYKTYEKDIISFDYEKMMADVGYSIEDVEMIQAETSVGSTPLYELKNLTKLARLYASEGKGARIFLKDEAVNPSGSFKARRASINCYHAKKMGYKGVIAATSGNYGAAVASQAAIQGLKCIIVQECYDSNGLGQPEIIEKARKCEAYGAEVIQLTVGPELFFKFLSLLEETGYFNASLYTPYSILGVETLGMEISRQMIEKTGKNPDCVVVTNAGGGNLTGTARGLIKSGSKETEIIAASVDLEGLHMASDTDFNKKSFTTGHTGFGIPFATFPDRSDVPRSAARPLRYTDKYVVVSQGTVFYMTELLAQIEGLERGPAGNVSLAGAFKLAQEMQSDQTIVVQETEYTGAGKHINAQLSFATENGIELLIGDPRDEIPGQNIILPKDPSFVDLSELDLDKIKNSLIRNSVKDLNEKVLKLEDLNFLVEETKSDLEFVKAALDNLKINYKE